MKVYVLYDDPYNEGWNIYGIFSSEDLLAKAIEKFTPYSNNELHWTLYDLDELTSFFETTKQRKYYGYAPFYSNLTTETLRFVHWDVQASELDSFLQKEERKDYILFSSALWFTVSADSAEDAISKANEMLKELIEQPEDERGWKWLEK